MLKIEQIYWLSTQGDRKEKDVLEDSQGMYVMMWSSERKQFVKVYMPKEFSKEEIKHLKKVHRPLASEIVNDII